MGVDVADLGGFEASVLDGGLDGDLGAAPSGSRPPAGSGVAAGAEAEDFAVDAGASGLGVLEFLDDQDAGAFAGDPAAAVAIEGAAGTGRVARPVWTFAPSGSCGSGSGGGSWSRRRR